MKPVLFIDRDGTIIIEPEDEQIDSFKKLGFYPNVISSLNKIANELGYELVMITNQDGLGTDSFPENTFWPVQNFVITTLQNEGIKFSNIFIDKTFPEENTQTRKPGIGLLTKYLNGNYDLENSYVIGDRITDLELANNIGSKAIFISSEKNADAELITKNWEEIYQYLKNRNRVAEVKRITKETEIEIELNLNGSGQFIISTGLKFFDHMLTQLAKHSSCNLKINVKGDLGVDEHHTIEDTAIALGEAFAKALGDKKGIERYGFLLPMDDSIANVAIDFSGRRWLQWKVKFKREKIGDVPTEMFYHFFKSFSDSAKCNIYIKAKGKNEHHKIEVIFKAFGRSIKQAVKMDATSNEIPSTKGTL